MSDFAKCRCAEILKDMDLFCGELYRYIKLYVPDLQNLAVKNWPPQLGIFPSKFPELQKRYAEVGIRFTSTSVELTERGHFDMLEDEEPGWVVVQVNECREECGEHKLYSTESWDVEPWHLAPDDFADPQPSLP